MAAILDFRGNVLHVKQVHMGIGSTVIVGLAEVCALLSAFSF